MLKEIKFRAWDNDLGMSEPFGLETAGIMFMDGGNPNEIMQYTGVKDKNGKEVYEGDILDNGYEKRIVKFKDGAVYQALLPQDENKKLFESWLPVMVVAGVLDDVEVIGDIYTTPELLKEGE